MQWTLALNTIFGSALLLILIFVNYIYKYNTDKYQSGIFLKLLVFTFIPMMMDFLLLLFEGSPGAGVTYLLYAILSVYYLFQIPAYFITFLFLDYMVHKNKNRSGLISALIWCAAAAHGIILALNLRWHFYFYITADNVLRYGEHYYIRLFISYLPVVFILRTVIAAYKQFKRGQTVMILVFFFFIAASSIIDMLIKTSLLIWPCFTAALLYAYFFIIRSDSKIDSLTGLGNRASFNEFIAMLSDTGGRFLVRRRADKKTPKRFKQVRESYAIVMIDMDHFKEINDTLGHLEGDNALRDMAAIIRGCTRSSDFAARYGGDEFILATRAEYDVEKLMARIQEAVNAQNSRKTRPYTLQISYGHDTYITNSGQSIMEFLKHIDQLMYKHKTERRRAEDRRGSA
ncbi:MAG: diguanylate cyclase [Treponema sp.]|jgi:diguanylate cyclase (GGDEF)-like protein|nr:diguanylate cyclase [Treponema sp.]